MHRGATNGFCMFFLFEIFVIINMQKQVEKSQLLSGKCVGCVLRNNEYIDQNTSIFFLRWLFGKGIISLV